ncbi:MAG: TIM barrel protein [Bacteroidales bacterium]|nr:TIM barrel protein [Bacteroidales bacterium]
MELGLSSYTYTWAVGVPGHLPRKPLTAIGLINKTYTAGLRLLQIADNLPVESMTPDEIDKISKFARQKKVRIEYGARGLTFDHAIRCLFLAERFDSEILRMVIDAPGFEPDLATVKSILRDLLPELKQRKIKLAIENHDRFKAKEFAEMVEYTASEWIGICLDSVNSMGAGEGFETVSEILLPYTINFHVKDFTIFRMFHKMGIVIEGRPAGKGMLNIPDMLHKLNEYGKCRSVILELWTPPEPDIEATIQKEEKWAVESIEYLTKLLK